MKRYWVVYDDPAKDTRLELDRVAAHGWRLVAVIPGFSYEGGRRCFLSQFIFEGNERPLWPVLLMLALSVLSGLLGWLLLLR